METGQVMWFADHVICRPHGVNHMVLSVLFLDDDKKQMTQETDPISLYGKLLMPPKNYGGDHGIFPK